MWPARVNSERGAALVATLVVSVLLLSLLIWYLSQAGLIVKLQTHEHATVYALNYAETGLLLAEQALQTPGVLTTTGTLTGSLELPNGRCAYTIERSPVAEEYKEVDPFERVFLEAVATGYYYLPEGAERDPEKGRAAQAAVLRSKLFFQTASTFLMATPGRLQIDQFTYANLGSLYARDWVIKRSEPMSSGPLGIDHAIFGNSVDVDEALVPEMQFIRITALPHFPALGGPLRAYYKNLAVTTQSRLDHDARLDGVVAPPHSDTFPVYYCDGDLHLGSTLPFEPSGYFIVYIKGNLIIHASIPQRSQGWAVFLVEKDIRLQPSSTVHQLALNGNFLANGQVRWDNPNPPEDRFTFSLTGNLLAGRGYDPQVTQLKKKLTHWQVDDAILPLPRLTQVLETRIVRGKYRH